MNQLESSSCSSLKSGTILWLTGWGMPVSTFDELHAWLPDFHHVSIDFSKVETPDEILAVVETTLRSYLVPFSEVYDGKMHSSRKLLVGGWSLGGLLALNLAAKGLSDGLVVLSGTACFVRPKEERDRGWPEAYVRQMIAAIRKDRRAVEAKFRRMLFTDREWEAGLGERLPQTDSWSPSALLAGLEILRSMECLSRLNRILCPVLLVHGSEDSICPYGAVEELLIQLPHAELVTVEGSGHVPFLGREAFIAKAIRRWWHGKQAQHNSTSI